MSDRLHANFRVLGSRLLSCVFLLGLVAAGCSDDGVAPGEPGVEDCQVDTDCVGGQVCWQDRCWPVCAGDEDCGDAERCVDSRCMPEDCEGVDCPQDQSCHFGECHPNCQTGSDCDEGLACVEGACVDPCDGVECSADETCYRGECFEACGPEAPCESDEMCRQGRCAPMDCQGVDCRDDETCHQGVCRPLCQDDDDCSAPEASCVDSACVDEPCEEVECFDGEFCYRGVCYGECVEDADCDEDVERCADGHCAPEDCEGVDCEEGQTCYRGICYEQCSEDGDCRGADRCRDDACIDPCEETECPEAQSCYRGECFDQCAAHGECGGDERCLEGQCVPLDCEGVDCNADETCLGGECFPSCDDGDDCTDGDVCHEGGCVDQKCDDGVILDDGCQQVLGEVVEVSDVTETTATFGAELLVPPVTAVDHGFCWATTDSPGDDDANCESLGAPGQSGVFSLDADGLQPGANYWVEAFVDTGEARYRTETISFATALAPVDGVTSTGYVDRVTISWDGVDGASDYRVIRDPGTSMEANLGPTSSDELDDPGADAGDLQAGPPLSFEVESGTNVVELNWTSPNMEDGYEHHYAVVAVSEDGIESPASDPVPGARRAAPITGYEVRVDGGWVDVGEATEWQDEEAEAGSIDVEGMETSVGRADRVDEVPLDVDQADLSDGPERDYRVRAVTEDADGDEVKGLSSWTERGRLLAENLRHQWQYDVGDGFDDVPNCDVDERECADTDGQVREDARDYRVRVVADGVEKTEYVPDADGTAGWVGVQGEVQTLEPDEVTHREATFVGEVVTAGEPEPSESQQGFCYSSSSAEPDQDDTCVEADEIADEEGEQFQAGVDGLEAETTYRVRAFVYTDADGASYDYGEIEEFETDKITRNIYTASDDDEVHKISPEGELIWDYTRHSDRVPAVTVDADGNVFSAASDGEVHKIRPDGTKHWEYGGHDTRLEDLVVDAEGNVYSAGHDDEIHHIDEHGHGGWTYTEHDSEVFSLAVDDSGYVCSGERYGQVHKINALGHNKWIYDSQSSRIRDVAVDADGYVYTAVRDDYAVHKIDPDGEFVWDFELGDSSNDRAWSVAVDPEGMVYAGALGGDIYKIDSKGEKVWGPVSPGGSTPTISVDADGLVYVGTSQGNVHKLDQYGDDELLYSGHESRVNDLAIDEQYTAAFPWVFQ